MIRKVIVKGRIVEISDELTDEELNKCAIDISITEPQWYIYTKQVSKDEFLDYYAEHSQYKASASTKLPRVQLLDAELRSRWISKRGKRI